MSNSKKDNTTYHEDRPVVVIIGVGGSGCNTVDRICKETNFSEKKGVEIYALNTDQQSLRYISNRNPQIKTLQLGLDGLGAGSNPETGRLAAEYSAKEIQALLEPADIVIIIAGFGGGTGTGASSLIAELAKKMDKLVIGLITKPFVFEGIKKLHIAKEGLKLFVEKADTTIVLSNQLLFSVTNSSTSLTDAYLMIDKVSIELVTSLIDMLKGIAMMNVDFADFKKATQNSENGGFGIVGFGEASGSDCAKRAVEMALSIPLFEPINGDNTGISGAKHILIHIMSEGAAPLTLSALENIITTLTAGAHKDVSIKVGVTVGKEDKLAYNSVNMNNESILNVQDMNEGKIKVVFIATGFDKQKNSSSEESNKNLDFPSEAHSIELKHEFNLNGNTSFLSNGIKSSDFVAQDDKDKKDNNKTEEKEKTDIFPTDKKKPFQSSFLDAIKNRFNLN